MHTFYVIQETFFCFQRNTQETTGFKNWIPRVLSDPRWGEGTIIGVNRAGQKTKIPVSIMNGKIKVTVNGELEVLDVFIAEELLEKKNHKNLCSALKKVFGEAIKKAKDLATSKVSAITGGLLPGT